MTHTHSASSLPELAEVYHYDSAVQTLFGENPVLLNEVMAMGVTALQAYIKRYHAQSILAPGATVRRAVYLDRLRDNLATGAALNYNFSMN